MRWKRTLQLVGVHCEGEPGRVVTGGLIDIPGETMAAKLHHLNRVDDSLRRFLCSEPRGTAAGSTNLLVPPTRSEAAAGFVILQPDQAHAMSGSNAMCVTTALLETGLVEMREPETAVVLDTAAGLVTARAACRDGRCERVTLEMPAAFVEALDMPLPTEHWGEIRVDLCYGGIFYALVDVAQLGLRIEPAQARQLAEAGIDLLTRVNRETRVRHPEIPEIEGVAYVMFRERLAADLFRTCTVLWPGRVDRSPCGTGSNANLAALQARGEAKPGDVLRSRSIVGGEFEVAFLETAEVAGRPAVRAGVSGRCWVYSIEQVGLDPTDPFPEGFRLSDTWGPLAG